MKCSWFSVLLFISLPFFSFPFFQMLLQFLCDHFEMKYVHRNISLSGLLLFFIIRLSNEKRPFFYSSWAVSKLEKYACMVDRKRRAIVCCLQQPEKKHQNKIYRIREKKIRALLKCNETPWLVRSIWYSTRCCMHFNHTARFDLPRGNIACMCVARCRGIPNFVNESNSLFQVEKLELIFQWRNATNASSIFQSETKHLSKLCVWSAMRISSKY